MNILNLFRHETDTINFAAGQTILSPNDRPRIMYVLAEGEAEISVNGVVVEVATPGALLNEMFLIDEAPGTAMVVAKTDCRLVAVDERRFRFLVQQTPNFALDVMKVIADRLRAMNQRVAG